MLVTLVRSTKGQDDRPEDLPDNVLTNFLVKTPFVASPSVGESSTKLIMTLGALFCKALAWVAACGKSGCDGCSKGCGHTCCSDLPRMASAPSSSTRLVTDGFATTSHDVMRETGVARERWNTISPSCNAVLEVYKYFVWDEYRYGPHVDFRKRWSRKRVVDLHHKSLERSKAITSPYRMPWHRDLSGQNVARPRWLWNRQSAKVFEWTLGDKLPEYTIISYTWGRWACDDTGTKLPMVQHPGVPWSLPTNTKFTLEELLAFLKTEVATEYVWLDILCVPQDNELDRLAEIEKQAGIFMNAKVALAWLWTIPNALPLTNIAAVLTHECYLLNNTFRSESGLATHSTAPAKEWLTLKDDPWFTSLWTLQEAVMAPGTVLVARDGTVAAHSTGVPVTVGFLTSMVRAWDMLNARIRSMHEVRFGLDGAGLLEQNRLDDVRDTMHDVSLWWDVDAGLSAVHQASRTEILRAASHRYFPLEKDRALAIMSAVGCYDWLPKPSSHFLGGFSLDFLQEVQRREGSAFFMTMPDMQIVLNKRQTMLPFYLPREPGNYHLFGCERSDVSTWQIGSDGSVTLPAGVRFYSDFRDYGTDGIHVCFVSQKFDGPVTYHITSDQQMKVLANRMDDAAEIRFVPLETTLLSNDLKNPGTVDERGILIAHARASDIWWRFGTFSRQSHLDNARLQGFQTETKIA